VQDLQRAGFHRLALARAVRAALVMEMLQQKTEEEREMSPRQKCSTFGTRGGRLLIQVIVHVIGEKSRHNNVH
jgi:hypothetical protein